MQDHLLAFLLAVLLLELPPGPNMAYLALGAGVLIQYYPLLYQGLRWIGVGYLLFLALEGYRTVTGNVPRAR